MGVNQPGSVLVLLLKGKASINGDGHKKSPENSGLLIEVVKSTHSSLSYFLRPA